MAGEVFGILAGIAWVAVGQHGDGDVAPDAATLARMESQIVERINAERKKRNVAPLKVSAPLTRAARKHSERMAREGFFEHTDKQERGPAERVEAEGYRWLAVGENIANNMGFKDPVDRAVLNWMNSPGHRRNILDGNFTETGVGIAVRGKTYYFTQDFASPR